MTLTDTFVRNKEDLRTKGYTLFPGLLNANEIQSLRNACLDYFEKGDSFIYYMGGKTQSDAMSRIGGIRFLMNNPKIVNVLKGCIGEDVKWLHHSDAHLNMLNGWHKDITGYVEKPWEKRERKEAFGIYKIAFYLQDHIHDKNGFSLHSGSHLTPDLVDGNLIDLHTKAGDALLFDQRLDHVGQEPTLLEKILIRFTGTSNGSYPVFQKWRKLRGVNDKMSVFMGFGNDNAFSDEFTKNVIARQNKQNKVSSYNIHPDVAERLKNARIAY